MNNNSQDNDKKQNEQTTLLRSKKLESLHNIIEKPEIDKIDNLSDAAGSNFYETLDLNLQQIDANSKYDFNKTLEVYGKNYLKSPKKVVKQNKNLNEVMTLNESLTSEIEGFSNKLKNLKDREKKIFDLENLKDTQILSISKNSTKSMDAYKQSLDDIIAELTQEEDKTLRLEDKIVVNEYIPEFQAKNVELKNLLDSKFEKKWSNIFLKSLGFKPYKLKKAWLLYKSGTLLFKEFNLYLLKNKDYINVEFQKVAWKEAKMLKFLVKKLFWSRVLHIIGLVIFALIIIFIITIIVVYFYFS